MKAETGVGSRIRTLREQAGVTQASLGAEIGVSRSHLTKIERGGDLPGRETLKAIADHFAVSLDWLTSGIGDPKPAKAMNESEALLLLAFRALPEAEAELLLGYLLKRTQEPGS